MPLILLALFLTLVDNQSLAAAETRACSFEALTSQCGLFDPSKGEKIELSDGTFIPNFSAILGAQQERKIAETDRKKMEKATKHRAKLLQIKYEITRLLDEIPDQQMHPYFKLHVTENFATSMQYMFSKDAEKLGEIQFPWPPENPEGVVAIPVPAFRERILPLFKLPQIERMANLTKELMAAFQEQAELGLDNPIFQEMKEATKERRVYIAKMVEFAKSRTVEIIRQGREPKKLSDQEKNVITRIETLRFTDPTQARLRMNPLCTSPVPNAYYNRADHSINVCPSFYKFPDSTILSVVAHEIGHVVDPCVLQFPIYQIRRAKLEAPPPKKKGESSVSADNQIYLMAGMLAKIGATSEMTAYPFAFYSSTKSVDYFEQNGILAPMVGAIPYGQYVLRDVYDCLKKDFRAYNPEEARRIAKQVVEVRKQFRSPSYNQKADEQKIVEAFSAYPECVEADKHSQMGEAIADWIASKVLGEFLLGMKLDTGLERIGPLAYFGNLVCMERFQLQQEETASVGGILRAAQRHYGLAMDAHPGSRDRIEKIFLADKNIRSALACGGPAPAGCEHKVSKAP